MGCGMCGFGFWWAWVVGGMSWVLVGHVVVDFGMCGGGLHWLVD